LFSSTGHSVQPIDFNVIIAEAILDKSE
jgi:hypothetical protein